MNFPDTLKYTKTHEWVKKLDENTALIGITDYAQHELGDIVFVEFAPSGENKGDVFVNLESVKAVESVYLPVSGKVIENNPKLEEDEEFELVNKSPYENGWLIKITLSNPAELSDLMDVAAYKKLVEEAK
ncbi:MAG: glycine cleavage system protein GcvH [Promethearchaeota archaeon]